jgi:DNA-binding IclR family transcriptional regulator
MLAYCDEQAEVDLRVRKTKYSMSTRSQLAVELAKVRAHGVAFEREESLLGSVASQRLSAARARR